MQDNTYLLSPSSKKVLAHDIVNVRAARSPDRNKKEKYSPLIISLPKTIADAVKVQKGDKMRIYTDGEKIYLDRYKEPEL